MVGQWFPKLGVWTEDGWNAHPFHANSEFFANFGDYTVEITVPEGYTVAATGVASSSSSSPLRFGEGQGVGSSFFSLRSGEWQGMKSSSSPLRAVGGGEVRGSSTYLAGTEYLPRTSGVRFFAPDVVDFAWAASPNFRTAARTLGSTELVYVYLPEHAWSVERVLDAAETAFTSFSGWYGTYPYPRLTLVDVPEAGTGAGGMEYPTLVTVGAPDLTGVGFDLFERLELTRGLELVTIHETAHQWWQALAASNEAEEPWLDEGLADYATLRAMIAAYGKSGPVAALGGLELGYLDLRRSEFLLLPALPMSGPAWDFTLIEYGVAAYSKPALALLTLERVLGAETMDALMRAYFSRYRFAHPTADDFRRMAVEVSGQELDWFFDGLVDGGRTLNYAAKAIAPTSLTVARQGVLAIPTEIEVTFADGSRERLAWDGEAEEQTFTFDRPLESFVIDPERDLLVELVWSDNGLAREPDRAAWLAAAARLLYRLQDWLLIVGGI
jgi:hypothetical protein